MAAGIFLGGVGISGLRCTAMATMRLHRSRDAPTFPPQPSEKTRAHALSLELSFASKGSRVNWPSGKARHFESAPDRDEETNCQAIHSGVAMRPERSLVGV